MSTPTIIFDSFYGSTEAYARELAKRTGGRLLSLDEAEADLPSLTASEDSTAEGTAGRAPLVVLSPVHGPKIRGAEFVSKHRFTGHPVAVVAVGMTLIDEARQKDQLAGPLGKLDNVARFYLPGRMNYSELSGAHRQIMRGIVGALRLKPRKSANERSMVECYGKDVDRIDFAELAKIESWIYSH